MVKNILNNLRMQKRLDIFMQEHKKRHKGAQTGMGRRKTKGRLSKLVKIESRLSNLSKMGSERSSYADSYSEDKNRRFSYNMNPGLKFKNNQYYPITSHGEQLEKPEIFAGGLIVLGDNAAPEIPDILKKIKKYKRLYDSIIAIRYINGLRFNLILYSFDSNGMIIKLNKDYASGIDKLMELDALQGILSRNIAEIDLRDIEKVLVKPR